MFKNNFQEVLREYDEAMINKFVLNSYTTGTLEDKTLREYDKAMIKNFFLITYISETLEGKTYRDLGDEQLMDELKIQWSEAVEQLPMFIKRLEDGEILATKYQFADQDNLLVGLTKVGPFMKIENSVLIGYSNQVFENSDLVDELINNHRQFYDISRVILNDAFKGIQKRTELEEDGIIIRRYLSNNESFLVHKMKNVFSFTLSNLFSYFTSKKSYDEFFTQILIECVEDIKAYDALLRFFVGQRDFVADNLRNQRTVSNESGVREIGELAKNLVYCYGRIREEKFKDFQTYMLYTPVKF